MNFNIDEYKINDNKIYINGWCHEDNYKIVISSNNEKKVINNYQSRYDICNLFKEEIKDNKYGFKDEIVFSNKILCANIYIEKNDKSILVYKIDERRIKKILNKFKKIGGKIKRGVKFLWREYHFLVPPKMMKKYIKMFFTKEKISTVYNPVINSEYNEWLSFHYEDAKKINVNLDLTNLDINSKTFSKDLSNIKTKYVCILSNKQELVEYFEFYIKKSLEEDYDLIYFDNDKKVNGILCNPFLKPDFSPDTLLGLNYIGKCFIIKTSILKNFNLKNLYEILLKFIDSDYKIKHISKILYHDLDDDRNDKEQVIDYLNNKGLKFKIKTNQDKISNVVEYIPSGKSLISIIIPTKDHADILKNCLESIYKKTTYKNYEIIVIDNNSEEEETFKLLKEYDKKYKNFKYKRIECEFNYSYLNNEAVKLASGDFVLLLNNDTEVITEEWLDIMVGYAGLSHVGAVGVKLIFPDETLQHAGVVMGKGGLVGHIHYSKPKDYVANQCELLVPYNYSVCTAACLMIEKKKYLEVNGLEEKLKVAFNDVDFNLKLLEKGYYNVFLPNVSLYHYESKSRGLDTTVEKQKRFAFEWAFIAEKWKKYIEHDEFYNDNFSKDEDYKLRKL